MANRFTDSRKWDDPWFRKLPCKYKAFFIFLLDKCDHAGIWKIDFESAEFHIGEKLDKNEILGIMNSRIIELKEKWFIPKFINFQYQVSSITELNPENRVHKSVIELLKKEGALKGLKLPLQGCKDKDMDMVKDKDKDKDDKGVVKGGYLENKEFEIAFNNFLIMRQEKKKPATKRAREIILTKLHKFDIEIAIKMLEQSTVNSWTDVYELKNKIESNLTKQQRSNLQGLNKTIERIKNDKRGVSERVSGFSGRLPGTTI